MFGAGLVNFMFPLLGKTVTRFWPLVLAAWLLLLGAGRHLAPAWDEVTRSGDTPFLPEDAPSRRGEQLFKKAFPDEYAGSGVVLVLSRDGDGTGLQESDKKFIGEVLTPALKKMAGQDGSPAARGPGPGAGAAGGKPRPEASRGEPLIGRIRSPGDEGVGALLLSRDKRAALVLVDLTTRFLDRRSWPAVEQIEGLVAGLRRDKEGPPRVDNALPRRATAPPGLGRGGLKNAPRGR